VDCKTEQKWYQTVRNLPAPYRSIAKFTQSMRSIHARIDSGAADRVHLSINSCLHDFRDWSERSKLIDPKEIDARISKLYRQILQIETVSGRRIIHEFANRGDLSGIRALLKINRDVLDTKSRSNKTPQIYYHEYYRMTETRQRIADTEQEGRDLKTDLNTKMKPTYSIKFLVDGMRSLGLEFKYPIKYRASTSDEEVVYTFTKPFFTKGFHDGDVPVMIFSLKRKGIVYHRLCWLSGSQGVWRITGKIFPDHISKSDMGEAALALPIKINFKLFEIYKTEQNNLTEIDKDTFLDFIRCIIDVSDKPTENINIERINGKRYYRYHGDTVTLIDAESLTYDDYSSIELYEKIENRHRMYRKGSLPPENPSKCTFENSQKSPDFGRPAVDFLSSDIIDNPYYGPQKATVFYSRDNTIRFLFLESLKNNKVFLATAEHIDAKITKHGINNRFTRLGGLDLPLLEYFEQYSPRYWPPFANPDKETYGDTWKYLKDVPMIKAYYTTLRRQIPN
jgi:hypothetical protein